MEFSRRERYGHWREGVQHRVGADAMTAGSEAPRDRYAVVLERVRRGLARRLGTVEHGLDVVAIRVAHERTEVAGVILRPQPRLVQ